MKKRYLITYDLNKPGQNYSELIEAIKAASDGGCTSYWRSSYLIRSDLQAASEVFECLKACLDYNDRLIVFEVDDNYYGRSESNENSVIELIMNSDF